jgi:hypothetical protein
MGTAGFLFHTIPFLCENISSSIKPVSVPGFGDWVNPISWHAVYSLIWPLFNQEYTHENKFIFTDVSSASTAGFLCR